MQYESNTDWAGFAETPPWSALPTPDDIAIDTPARWPSDTDAAKLPPRLRLAIIAGGALAAWMLFLAIGWAVLATLHTIMGH